LSINQFFLRRASGADLTFVALGAVL